MVGDFYLSLKLLLALAALSMFFLDTGYYPSAFCLNLLVHSEYFRKIKWEFMSFLYLPFKILI